MKIILKSFAILSAIILSNVIVYKYSSFKKDTEIKKYKKQACSLNDKNDILKHIEDVTTEIKLYCMNDTQFKVDQVLKLEDEKINKLATRLEVIEKYMKQGGIDWL